MRFRALAVMVAIFLVTSIVLACSGSSGRDTDEAVVSTVDATTHVVSATSAQLHPTFAPTATAAPSTPITELTAHASPSTSA